MLDFLRPVEDVSLRIMVADGKSPTASGGDAATATSSLRSAAASSTAINVEHRPATASISSGDAVIHNSPMITDSDEDTILDSPPVRRRYQAYTVMQRSGFQHTEYVQIITHLCKAEILLSVIFLTHGLSCPGFQDDSVYQGTCHINVLAALVGIFTGGVGLGAVHRFRWKNMLVMWLIMCIISSVANLLAVITTGIWLDHLSKMKERTGIANGLSGMMLLGSVLVGVCFILTAVLICHYWASNSTKYQAVGRMAKRTRSLRRRSSRASSGTERSKPSHRPIERIPSIKHQYHIV